MLEETKDIDIEPMSYHIACFSFDNRCCWLPLLVLLLLSVIVSISDFDNYFVCDSMRTVDMRSM